MDDCIKILSYSPDMAAAVARMWNLSRENWGGGNQVRTAAVVAAEHENSSLLDVFIAVDGDNDEVVGYCSFGRHFKDNDALYIPLLNVRPDYHGRKIGRALVRRAVQRTIEMGIPRLDLFTWPGNTKAVPLYKKCGFFWEKRDDTTHLMNFIPNVLSTALFIEYFQKADWYEDSVRKIEVCPDGVKENGFDILEYSWEKDGSRLRVGYERTYKMV